MDISDMQRQAQTLLNEQVRLMAETCEEYGVAEVLLVSNDPLLPMDDPDSITNGAYYHHGNGRYEYNLDGDLTAYMDQTDQAVKENEDATEEASGEEEPINIDDPRVSGRQ